MSKIPLYPSKTAPSNDDLLILEDVTSNSTKKIKRGDLLAGTQLPVDTVNSQAIQDDAILNAKIPDGEIQPIKMAADFSTVATTSSLAPSRKLNLVTALGGAIAIAEPIAGLKNTGQSIIIRIKDNGTARAISWDAIYRAVGVTLPTTTTIGKTLYVAGIYNVEATKVDILAVGREA